MHSFFDLTYFREVGQKNRNIFVHFLVQMKTSKSHSEIIWPLRWLWLWNNIGFMKLGLLCLKVNRFNIFILFFWNRGMAYVLKTWLSTLCQPVFILSFQKNPKISFQPGHLKANITLILYTKIDTSQPKSW